MNWLHIRNGNQTDKYAIQSEDGTMTICRKWACGQMFHELWKGKDFQFCHEDVNEVKRYAEQMKFPAHHENNDGQ